MRDDLRISVSKYVSYLLRHNPEDLTMDDEGFVELGALLSKVGRRFPTIDENLLMEIINLSECKRIETVGDKIRALYGHTVDVQIHLKEDKETPWLYHGTTPQAADEILTNGLKPMKRRWVHLSPTEDTASEVGKRRTKNPVILIIDAERARRDDVRFYEATDKVYVCKHVPAKYIKRLHD